MNSNVRDAFYHRKTEIIDSNLSAVEILESMRPSKFIGQGGSMKLSKLFFNHFILSIVSVFVFSSFARAQVMAEIIPTPRGESIQVTVFYGDGTGPTLFVAPGDDCAENPNWLQALGDQGPQRKYTVVTLRWAYCLTPATSDGPSADLSDELEDFQTAYRYALEAPLVNEDRMILAGQELGSRVAYRAFRVTPAAKALALLSPVCSEVRNGRTVSLAAQNYPAVRNERRRMMVTLGRHDTQCRVDIMKAHLKSNRVRIVTHSGNQDFMIRDSEGEIDELASRWMAGEVIRRVLNWADVVGR